MPYKEKSKYDDFQMLTLIAKNSGIPKIIIDEAIIIIINFPMRKHFAVSIEMIYPTASIIFHLVKIKIHEHLKNCYNLLS